MALIKIANATSGAPAAIHGERLKIAPGDSLTVLGYGLTRVGDGKSGGTLRSATLTVTGQPGNLQIRLMDAVGPQRTPGPRRLHRRIPARRYFATSAAA